ncbi:MAG: 50S ribosomal protein L6 [Myxococcales bacterium]|nr:50S ribosomal protein L6 [Myxococcales bacterium]
MSRIGKTPIKIPKGVQITTSGQHVAVKGPKGSLSFDVPEPIGLTLEGDVMTFVRKDEKDESRQTRAFHGMSRAMVANMVTGCSEGFTRVLEIIGVGYRAAVKDKKIDLTLGFSHPVSYELPDGVTADFKDGKLTLMSANKALLGQVASDIRRWRPPEPYKGKGIRYLGEHIIKKEGKARGKK